MFNLPTIDPENVSRDFIDVFGGYNHNLRINDNEFFDMKNLSSSCYPMMATRQRRGGVPDVIEYGSSDRIVGTVYRSALYYLTVTVGESGPVGGSLTLHRVEAGRHEIIKRFDILDGKQVPSGGTTIRNMIMMGAYMLIFPDKLYVNVENPEDCGYIEFEAETVNDTVTIQPCLEDGSVISIDYVGNKCPSDYGDGYVWVDTSVDPASVKRYNTKSETWIPVIFQYIRLTASNTAIASGFDVGDGVKISGVSIESEDYDLNGVSILREKPDDRSIVVSGVFTNDNIRTFKPIKEPLRPTQIREHVLRVFCNKNVLQDEFKNKYFLIGTERIKCIGNTVAKPYEYWEDKKINMTSMQAEYLTSENSAQVLSPSGYMKFNVVRRENEGIMWRDGTLNEEDPLYVRIGNTISNRNVFRYRHDTEGNNPTENANQISIQSQNYSVDYLPKKNIGQTPYPYIPALSRIYPIQRGNSNGLYETTLILNVSDAADYENDILCLEPEYVVENTEPVTFERKMPLMDYMIESNNRLWGCRYGENIDGDFVNELYASKSGNLGFKNWQCFEGVIATNSYAVSRGIDGPWTGAINYLGHPVFFKENYIETVYGSYPAQFSIDSVTARGVQQGSDKSLAILNEVLYYLSPDGVCQYNGSLPMNISYNFGDRRYSDAVACALNGKYYICLMDGDYEPLLMVFDSTRNLWHKEDNLDIIEFCPVSDDIYFLNDDRELRSLFGTGTQDPDPVEWYAETGIYGLSQSDSKYISRLNIRMALEKGATVILSIQYDSSGVWERLCTIVRQNINPFTLPIKPRRCDHFRLRLEGVGGAKVYSIAKTIEQGSDTV